ncbi:MAG: glycosyltransferase family 39 protein [Daejeonella sp.]
MEVKRYESQQKQLLLFLLGWIILNSIQASFTELHADEAYYWLYSQFLDWGYFDHPPMVALFIKAGDLIYHSPLTLRLITILTNTLSVYVLWKIVSKYAQNLKLFILLFSSLILFHVYGFITTSDSPLFFFSVLFFYVYQKYLEDDKLKWTVCLSLIIAGLFYSKYHGMLVIVFTVLSNINSLKRLSFWLIAGFSLILFIPHIWWQFQNNFPSLYYHLIDRSAKSYKFNYTSEYLLAQFFLAGPLIGWYIYKSAMLGKPQDQFIKTLKFNCYGIFAFFLLSTFKGRVEPHWTLIAFIPLFILSYIYLSQKTNIPKWFSKLAVVNIVLILITRVLIMVPIPGIKEIGFIANYFDSEKLAKQLKEKAGDEFIILERGFQGASLYDYYNNTTKGFAYDSRYYRKTQFDLWPIEDSLRNKRVYYISQENLSSFHQDTLKSGKQTYFGRWIDQVRLYQKVMIETDSIKASYKPNEKFALKLKVDNPYQVPINFSNHLEKWDVYIEYGFMEKGKFLDFKSLNRDYEQLRIPSLKQAEFSANLQAPAIAGKYKLIFSIRTEPFSGSRNSKMINFEVK